MANPHPTPHTKPYPWLTCVTCGVTKRATRFPKRGGPSYENKKATDPKRYDTQCKLCKKPKGPRPHTEPKTRGMGRPKKKKKTRRISCLTPKQRKLRTRNETRIKSMLYLSEKGCCKCHERDPRKLEYDHRDPLKKDRIVARLIVDGYSWASAVLRSEIQKCRILCANCHRVHTIKQQGYYSTPPVQECLKGIAKKYGFET